MLFQSLCEAARHIASPWETFLSNKWLLPIFASGNPVPKAGTIVEVEVSEQANPLYPAHPSDGINKLK